MKRTISRRELLKAGLATSTGALLVGASALPVAWAAEEKARFCLALCNHWSYTGIGWQSGIESNVLSATDAMEIVDLEPHIKTCINLDARAFELMAEKFPEVANRLKTYLAAGKLELIGGTYGQPMGTTVGGESNIRQIVLGFETIRKALDYEMATFLEEEEFTHPQVPQLAAGAGFKYASLAQLDTWGLTGIPYQEYNVINWKGVDGTTIPCIPKNTLPQHAEVNDITEQPLFKKLQAQGMPLLFGWEEFGWEDPEHPASQQGTKLENPLPDLYPVHWGTLKKFKAMAAKYPVEFVTLKEYLDKYGSKPEETIYLPMNAFGKWLTWGLGGDQVRIFDRKLQALLLSAEIFDAAATALGAKSQAEPLEKAWKDLLASQSHDVGLCEYSRWQGDRMAPLERIEDTHNFPWGGVGYNLMDAAQKQGQVSLDVALKTLSSRINSQEKKQGQFAVTVFNPLDKDQTDVAMTGRIFPLPEKTQAIVVKDASGRVLPSQVVKSEKDRQGNFVMAELAFPAAKVPSVGYGTYYLDTTSGAQANVKTDLSYDESKFLLENEYLRVRVDPKTGAVASLVHKKSGREMIDQKGSAFPHFKGKPNPNLSRRPEPPANYDSATSQGRLDWYAKGPLFATVRAHHRWKYLNFETRVTLTAGRPYVEVVTRVFSQVPPLFAGIGPLDMNSSAYWLSFKPSFEVQKVIRDYPLAVEATESLTFHALTFADLIGKDAGLLILHPGTQWFARDKEGTVGNLLMREWESFWTNEYGWPLYAEYRHALMPHGLDELNNAARLRAAAAFTQPLLCHIDAPHTGDLPASKSFVRVAPESVMLSAFRKKTSPGLELRVVETEGQTAETSVEIGLPVAGAVETNLRGRKVAEVTRRENKLTFPIDPWKIRTFEVS
jgi:alpha-mannosidase